MSSNDATDAEEPKVIDGTKFIKSMLNMKSEIEFIISDIKNIKNQLNEDIEESKSMRGEVKKELDIKISEIDNKIREFSNSIQKMTNMVDNISLESSSSNSRSVRLPGTREMSMDQQEHLTTMQSIAGQIFEKLGNLTSKLEQLSSVDESLRQDLKDIKEKMISMESSWDKSETLHEKNTERAFKLSHSMIRVTLVALAILGAALGIKELFALLPDVF